MATVQMFYYNNFIGAVSDIDNGNFINDPTSEGQLGCVLRLDEIEVTSEVVEHLKNAKREGGSFASIMLTKLHPSVVEMYGEYSIGIMGFYKHAFNLNDNIISRDCDLTGLDHITINDDIEIPPDFMEYVDNYK
jgi:hypothetical protein